MTEEFAVSKDSEQVNRPIVSRPRKQRKVAVVIAFGTLVLTTLAGLWGTGVWKQGLSVRRIFVEGNRIIAANELAKLTRITAGAGLYAVDLNRVEENILQQVYIRSVSAGREFPDALRIWVQERQPLAAISAGGTLFLDEAGFVLPQVQSAEMFDVPFITGFPETQSVVVGQSVVDPHITYALDLLKKAKDLDGDLFHIISEVHVNGNGDLVLYSSDAGVTILFGKDDEEQKLAMLRVFWNRFVLQRGVDKLQLVDLRYADQVIARWKDSNNAHRTAF